MTVRTQHTATYESMQIKNTIKKASSICKYVHYEHSKHHSLLSSHCCLRMQNATKQKGSLVFYRGLLKNQVYSLPTLQQNQICLVAFRPLWKDPRIGIIQFVISYPIATKQLINIKGLLTESQFLRWKSLVLEVFFQSLKCIGQT